MAALVECGVDVNHRVKGVSPLGCALLVSEAEFLNLSKLGCLRRVALQLLKCGARVNGETVPPRRSPLLHRLLRLSRRMLLTVQQLMEYNVDMMERDRLGRTVLHHIVYCRTTTWNSSDPSSLVAYDGLLTPQMLEAVDRDGCTALHLAVQTHNLSHAATFVEWLLGAGAIATARDRVGRTPLHHLGMMLRTYNFPSTQLFSHVAQVLVEAGCEWSVCDDDGLTPGELAALGGVKFGEEPVEEFPFAALSQQQNPFPLSGYF